MTSVIDIDNKIQWMNVVVCESDIPFVISLTVIMQTLSLQEDIVEISDCFEDFIERPAWRVMPNAII